MNTYSTRFKIVFICWLLSACALRGGSLEVSLQVSAFRHEFPANTPAALKVRPMYRVRYVVTVRNHGVKPIRIPTAGFAQPTEAGPGYTRTGFLWSLETDEKDFTTVVSEAELKPVTLRPNEATVLQAFETEYNLSRLNDIQFSLRITEAFGKRYDLWFGEISATDIKLYRETDQDDQAK